MFNEECGGLGRIAAADDDGLEFAPDCPGYSGSDLIDVICIDEDGILRISAGQNVEHGLIANVDGSCRISLAGQGVKLSSVKECVDFCEAFLDLFFLFRFGAVHPPVMNRTDTGPVDDQASIRFDRKVFGGPSIHADDGGSAGDGASGWDDADGEDACGSGDGDDG